MKREKILTIGLILATVILATLAVLTAWKIATRKPVAPTVPQVIPRAVEPNPNCKLSFSVSPVLTLTPTLTGSLTPTLALTLTPTGSLTPTPTGTLVPTSTPTSTPTSIPTITPTPTPLLGCYRECSSDDDCEGTLRCQTISGVKRCLDLGCPGENDCICNVGCWKVCGQDKECASDQRCRSIDGAYRCVDPDCEREQDCDCIVAQVLTITSKPTGSIPTGLTPTPVELPEAGVSLPTIVVALGGVILTIAAFLLAL